MEPPFLEVQMADKFELNKVDPGVTLFSCNLL